MSAFRRSKSAALAFAQHRRATFMYRSASSARPRRSHSAHSPRAPRTLPASCASASWNASSASARSYWAGGATPGPFMAFAYLAANAADKEPAAQGARKRETVDA